MAEAGTLIEIPNLTGAALKSWATKNGFDYEAVKAVKAAGGVSLAMDFLDASSDPPPPAAKPSDDLSRSYTFRVIPTHRQAGKNLNLRIMDPNVVVANKNARFIRFKKYVFTTKSRAIRNYLRDGIKAGTFPFLFEDVQVLSRCAVPDCDFVSTKTGPAGMAELNAHFMAKHAGTVDEDGDED